MTDETCGKDKSLNISLFAVAQDIALETATVWQLASYWLSSRNSWLLFNSNSFGELCDSPSFQIKLCFTTFSPQLLGLPHHCHARAAINTTFNNYTNHRSCLFHLVIVLHVIVLNEFIWLDWPGHCVIISTDQVHRAGGASAEKPLRCQVMTIFVRYKCQ